MNDSIAGSGETDGLGELSGPSLPAAGGQSGSLCFVLPSLPVSINELYKIDHRRRRVDLSDEALLWRTRMTPHVLACRWPMDWLLKLTLNYESPRWLTKQGSIRRIDHANYEKLVTDTLFKKWGRDDSMLVEIISRKVYGPREQIQVTLERALVQLTEVG